jgi:hypothetical protein
MAILDGLQSKSLKQVLKDEFSSLEQSAASVVAPAVLDKVFSLVGNPVDGLQPSSGRIVLPDSIVQALNTLDGLPAFASDSASASSASGGAPNNATEIAPIGAAFKQYAAADNLIATDAIVDATGYSRGQQFTADNEALKTHLYHPSRASGVTIGIGYDLGQHSRAEILADMKAAGVPDETAQQLATAEKATGTAADRYVQSHSRLSITTGQAEALFRITYAKKAIYAEHLVATYTEAKWTNLSDGIKDTLIDLTYRGDLTQSKLSLLNSSLEKNDHAAFAQILGNRVFWQNVPADRFEARIEFLSNNK